MTPDHELEHRTTELDQCPHGVVALVQSQVARVEAVRSDGDERLGREPLLLGERTARRLLARLIRVEREDDLARAGRVGVIDVADHAPHDLDVVDAERRAAGRNRCRDAGEVARHDVGVALDHDHLPAARDVLAGQVEPVQHLALVVDRRLGRVQVFGTVVVIQQLARAETERCARDVADRPDQATAEAVVDVATIATAEQARRHQLLLGVAQRLQMLAQRPAARGETDAETLRRRRVETAGTQERTTGLGLRRRQLRDEEILCRLIGSQDARAHPVVAGLPTILVMQLVPDAGRHPLDRLGERDVVHLLQEREDVAALAAAEAVVETHLGPHVEAGAALLVEGAEALHRPDAGVLQRDVLAHDVGDVGA